jgi:putative endonuclease
VRSSRLAALGRGRDAEELVARRLASDGWTVLARNWRGAGGELDIVVVRDGHLRFVEVKARDPADDTALEAIGRTKQRKLARAAEQWLASRGPPERDAAFLVAVVTLGSGDWTVTMIDNAFDV